MYHALTHNRHEHSKSKYNSSLSYPFILGREFMTKGYVCNHIWKLRDQDLDWRLTWGVLGHARPYNPMTGICRLCWLEKYFILYGDKVSLNKRRFTVGAITSRNIFSRILCESLNPMFKLPNFTDVWLNFIPNC